MKKIFLLCFVLSFGFTINANAKLVEEEIEYKAGDTNLKGYFVYDNKIEGKRPGVIVVHEWWGQNDYVRKRAKKLAKMGYAAFAIDMFGDGKTTEQPFEANELINEIMIDMRSKGKDRFLAALEMLKQKVIVEQDNIAAIGYSFGGSVIMSMARYGIDLKGIVSFYGGVKAFGPTPKGRVKAEILVFIGADDPYVSKEHIDEFTEDMDSAGVEYEIINYDGVGHSFTDPKSAKLGKRFGMPFKYNRKADKDSWAKTGVFLERIFAE